MAVFYVDLDNTLIYSYKHAIAGDKINVERYQGREISYITKKTHQLLLELKKLALIVPVTTRTIEQYGRICLNAGGFRYALVCNGGVLLTDGKVQQEWLSRSKELTAESFWELEKAAAFLEKEPGRIFEVRFIQKLFVFTKCRLPEIAVGNLKKCLDESLVDVFHNGEKVYVVPKALNKGNAVLRFQEYSGAGAVFAAGDSEFDLPMLEQADFAAAPAGYAWKDRLKGAHISLMPKDRVFSEAALAYIMQKIKETS